MYIVFEGIVGTGKSTQVQKLVEYLEQKYPQKEVVLTREPGGTEIADTIRNVVQGMEFDEEMEHICEAYLYAASRAHALRKVVRPALEKGHFVVSDRSFLSSLTNQAFGRELGYERVYKINEEAIKDLHPDVVIYLEYDIKKGMQRAYDEKGDKFERMDEEQYIPFYTKVSQGYEFVASHPHFKEKWLQVDASGTPQEVFELIVEGLKPHLKKS